MSGFQSKMQGVLDKIERNSKKPHFFLIQFQIARFVYTILLGIGSAELATYLGARPMERLGVAFAGLVYGLVGTPYLFAVISKIWASTTQRWSWWLMALLCMSLLAGPVLFASVWMAIHLEADAPWHLRLSVVGLGVALVIAGFKELFKGQEQQPEGQ